MRLITAPIALGFLAILPLSAQEIPDLVTDRPDQTESSVVVPKGSVQLELGWSHEEDKAGGESYEIDSAPESLLRVGVAEDLELRFGAPVHEWLEEHFPAEPSREAEGWSDLEIGLKKHLWEEDGCRPEAALLFHVSLPTGAEGHSSERADPNFRFAFSHELNDRVSFGYNLGASWETQEDSLGDLDTVSYFNWTGTLGFALSDRLGAFAEFFGNIPMSAPGRPETSFDGGFTYLVTDNFQLDALAGVGISEDAPDWFIGAGVTYRWPR
jgi:hypothetical protein